MMKPTRKERDVFDWITAYIQREKRPPTVMEVGSRFKVSGASAYNLILELVYKGYLERSVGIIAPCYQPAPVCPVCGSRMPRKRPARSRGSRRPVQRSTEQE